jgi:hypothetical protein
VVCLHFRVCRGVPASHHLMHQSLPCGRAKSREAWQAVLHDFGGWNKTTAGGHVAFVEPNPSNGLLTGGVGVLAPKPLALSEKGAR